MPWTHDPDEDDRYADALRKAFRPGRLHRCDAEGDALTDGIVCEQRGPLFSLRNSHGFMAQADAAGTITVAISLIAECPEPPPNLAIARGELPNVDVHPLPHESGTFATIDAHDRSLRELLESLGFRLTDWPHHPAVIERNLGDGAFESWVLSESKWFLATDCLDDWVGALVALMACPHPTLLL
jgi:hypothetical protein